MLLGMEKKCMSESISKAKRLPYWDTMKGILIILVVLGHFLWDFTTPEHPGIQFFIHRYSILFPHACLCFYLRIFQPQLTLPQYRIYYEAGLCLYTD